MAHKEQAIQCSVLLLLDLRAAHGESMLHGAGLSHEEGMLHGAGLSHEEGPLHGTDTSHEEGMLHGAGSYRGVSAKASPATQLEAGTSIFPAAEVHCKAEVLKQRECLLF